MLAALGLSRPATAAADVDLISANSLSLSGDVRLVAADGEESWVDGKFGKLRSSGDANGGFRVRPELGSADLVWQPRIGFAWSATIVGTVQGGERTEAGLSEAFVSYKPMRSSKMRFSARAGLMWPPISLEHGGADWHVLDTITPSAINSWVGEEVRPLAAEASVSTNVGDHEISATAAVMAANDTAGTLLAFRGWALHDRRTLAFRRQPLPPLPPAFEYIQPQFTHPLLDVDRGFAKRPGYYAKLAWQSPENVRVELFRYDNRADPEAVNEDLEWGWRTRFNQVALLAQPSEMIEIKAQAMQGSTLMGFPEMGRIWVDTPFRSAFVLISHRAGKGKVAGRIEAFDLRQKGSLLTSEADEEGWSGLLAYSHPLPSGMTALLELLHVSSRRPQRNALGLFGRQNQTQLQASLRFHW
jgi:hypothetical protein